MTSGPTLPGGEAPAPRARGRRPAPVGGTEGRIPGSGRVGVTYKYFGAPDGATAARVPISMRPEELGGDELGMGGMFTKIKPETIAAMVLTGIQGMPLNKVPPLELVVLHPDYAVVKLPMTAVDPLRGIGEESVGAAAFIWSTVPDRGGPGTRSTSTNCFTSGRTSATGCTRRGTSRTAWCGRERRVHLSGRGLRGGPPLLRPPRRAGSGRSRASP